MQKYEGLWSYDYSEGIQEKCLAKCRELFESAKNGRNVVQGARRVQCRAVLS